ncbi:MAG TPA: hypothetical protein GXX18_17675 [Bacillales bacterium]|nr:hypothetical protein [Bacillales bacterium]
MSSKKHKHRKEFEESLMEDFTHGNHHHHPHPPPHHEEDHGHCHEEHDNDDKDCICSIVKRILKAQEMVDDCRCRVSCERSIRQLHTPYECPPADTIPFTLTCGCDLFCGKGAIYSRHGNFCLISSPFFRVKKVDHHCCAVLELLWPTFDGEPIKGPLTCRDNNFPCNDFNGFIGTGVCITVDLSCFCSISCLKPHMVNKATASQIQQIIKGH